MSSPLDWLKVVNEVGIPFATLVGVLVVTYKIGMKAIAAYAEDQKSKREERTLRASHEKELLGLYTQLSAAIQLLREANEKQNEASERQSANFVRALEAMTAQLAEMPKAWLLGLNAGLADVYNRAEAGHKDIVVQVGNKVDLAVLDIDKAISESAGATQDRLATIESQITGLTAALAAAMAKEFAPVVAEQKELRSAVEHAVGEGLRDALKPLLDEHQRNLETALVRAAQSTIETVTSEVKRMAEHVAAAPPVPPVAPVTVSVNAPDGDENKA